MKDGNEYKYYSNGQWKKSNSGDLIPVYNPYNYELIANIQASTKEEAEQAIEISNKSEYGLQGMIFTENIDLVFNIAQELEVGTVQVNGQSSRGPDHFPFLGKKSSGLAIQGIKYSIEAMSHPKVVVLNLSEKEKLVKECYVPRK